MKSLAPALASLAILMAGPAWAADAPAPGMAGKPARSATTVLGGYYDLEFKQPFNGPGSNFDQHHLVLTATSNVLDRLLFNAEVEFEHGGLINAGTKDGEIEIEQAWADYNLAEWLSLRAGVVLIPFGIVNVFHDSDIRETTTRPLMANMVIPSTWFEPGVGLHGVVYPYKDWQLSYEGYATQGLTDVISPALGLRGALPSLSADNNGNKALTGRVAVSPFLGLEVGADTYYGAYDPSGVQHVLVAGADAHYTLGPAEVLAEYANVNTQGGTSSTASVPVAIPTGMDGFYVEGRYHFFPAILDQTCLGHAGGFEHAGMTAVARWGFADTNLAAFDASDQTEALVGLNYRPVPSWVLKLELQHLTAPATSQVADALWSSVAVGF